MSNYGRIVTVPSNYGVTKAVIAEIFNVSRSAVTQSCTRKHIDEDLTIRIYQLLRGCSRNIYVTGKNAQENSLLLLSRLRNIMSRREAAIANRTGRPTQQIKFSIIKRLVREIVAKLWQPVAEAPIVEAKFEHKRLNTTGKRLYFLEGCEEILETLDKGVLLAWYGYYAYSDFVIERFGELTIESTRAYFKLCADSGAEKDYNW